MPGPYVCPRCKCVACVCPRFPKPGKGSDLLAFLVRRAAGIPDDPFAAFESVTLR